MLQKKNKCEALRNERAKSEGSGMGKDGESGGKEYLQDRVVRNRGADGLGFLGAIDSVLYCLHNPLTLLALNNLL